MNMITHPLRSLCRLGPPRAKNPTPMKPRSLLRILLPALVAIGACLPAHAQTRTYSDISYGPDPLNKLDYYQGSSAQPTPLVVYIHGGGFKDGDKRDSKVLDQVSDYLAAGLSVASINYRRISAPDNSPAVPIQDVLRDCARSVQFLRTVAGEGNWKFDPARIGTAGSSAGGGTALWIAVHADLINPGSSDPVLHKSSRVLCAVSNSGQFTYDFPKWRTIFGDAAVDAYGGSYNSPEFGGFTNPNDIYSSAGIAIRQDCDMHGLIAPGAPPIWVDTGTTSLSVNRLTFLHHPWHVREIYNRCQAQGVTVVAKSSALGLQPTAGQPSSDVAFMVKYLTGPIAPSTPTVSTISLPDGRLTEAYTTTQLTATGGTPPYSWSLASGQLPPGITGNSAGSISGQPTTVGTTHFTVRVTDSANQSATKPLSITVTANSVPTITTTSLPDGATGTAYSQTISSAGGDGMLTWSLVSGARPPGLEFSTAFAQNVTLSGTPTAPGTYPFTAAITDIDGDSSSRAFSVTITEGTSTVATPVFSPAGGTYEQSTVVSLSTATSGAAIYYTTNGTTPTTASTLYTSPRTVSASTTVKAIAAKSGLQDSAVASATYAIGVETPVFSPAGGSYASPTVVSLTTATNGASIYYTTNGTTPSATNGTLYTSPRTISSSMTVKAIALKSGVQDSAVASETYAIGSN